jgi:hypothetical protein
MGTFNDPCQNKSFRSSVFLMGWVTSIVLQFLLPGTLEKHGKNETLPLPPGL